MDFNQTLALLSEAEEKYVKIKGTKNAEGKDLYDTYPWFKDYFPDKKNITGIRKGTSGSSVFDQKKYSVQFAVIKNGKVEKKAGHSNSFTGDQLTDI